MVIRIIKKLRLKNKNKINPKNDRIILKIP